MTEFSRKNTSSEIRRSHNNDLIRRMRGGESLTAIDSKASWFPPRPIIQKDKSEMTRLYGAHEPKPVLARAGSQQDDMPREKRNVLAFPDQNRQ